MSARFQVNITNNSRTATTFILFQKEPNGGSSQVFSTVWFSKWISPNSQAIFDWGLDYNFVSGNSGQLMPGVQFMTNQIINTNPNTSNAVQFGNNGGGFGFFNQQAQPGGRFSINVDASVPQQGQYSVGIGMANVATLVTSARPNMNYQFSPNTEYWVAFGNYETGQVLNSNVQNAARIAFPNGVTKMNVVLNQDNSYTINPA